MFGRILPDDARPVRAVEDVVEHAEAEVPTGRVHSGGVAVAHRLLEGQPAAGVGHRESPAHDVVAPAVHELMRWIASPVTGSSPAFSRTSVKTQAPSRFSNVPCNGLV